MLREKFRLRFDQVRKSRFHDFGDLLMKTAALGLVDRAIQSFLDQCVLKEVTALWRLTLGVDDSGRHQLCQFGPERLFVNGHDGREQSVIKLTAECGGELGYLTVTGHLIEPGHHEVL